MRKAQRIRESCEYKVQLEGSLIRRIRRHVPNRNIHGIIFNKERDFSIDLQDGGHASDGFLIAIADYTHGTIHGNHSISALLIQGRLYAFNPHGDNSQPMDWLVNFIRNNGGRVDSFIQYFGPNLQSADTRGVCFMYASKFLELHPNSGMNQEQFNRYVFEKLSGYKLEELYKYLNKLSNIHTTGLGSNNNRNKNRNRNRNIKRKSIPRNMNINLLNRPTRMNVN